MPPTDPMTPQRLREIADSIEEWADTRAQERGAAELRAHANQIERNAELLEDAVNLLKRVGSSKALPDEELYELEDEIEKFLLERAAGEVK